LYENNNLQSDDLDKGEYILIIKAIWNPGLKYSYRLSSYGPQEVWMQPEPF
jgi:hypothetical protein